MAYNAISCLTHLKEVYVAETKSTVEARVRGEIRAGELIVSLEAAKGSPGEAEALNTMEYFMHKLAGSGLRYQAFMRNTPKGDFVDQIRIQL